MAYYRVRRTDSLTPILVLVGLNLLVFIAINFNRELVDSLKFIPVSAYLFNQPWTIITSIFSHEEFGHILFNMIALYFFGRFVIELLGQNSMLLIYFIGGIVGNLFCFIDPPLQGVIGASGAIYALMGTLIILRPGLRVIIFPIFIPMPLWVATLIGFVLGLIIAGVAWQAHLGGLIVGLIGGLLLRKRMRVVF